MTSNDKLREKMYYKIAFLRDEAERCPMYASYREVIDGAIEDCKKWNDEHSCTVYLAWDLLKVMQKANEHYSNILSIKGVYNHDR